MFKKQLSILMLGFLAAGCVKSVSLGYTFSMDAGKAEVTVTRSGCRVSAVLTNKTNRDLPYLTLNLTGLDAQNNTLDTAWITFPNTVPGGSARNDSSGKAGFNASNAGLGCASITKIRARLS
jgi:hypothetical protein